jgi:hypothetical protein
MTEIALPYAVIPWPFFCKVSERIKGSDWEGAATYESQCPLSGKYRPLGHKFKRNEHSRNVDCTTDQ